MATPAKKMTEAERKAKAAELKAERASGAAFVRLANKRTRVVLKGIALLGNLASYPHKPEQAQAVVDALTEAVSNLSVKYAGTAKTAEGFTVPE